MWLVEIAKQQGLMVLAQWVVFSPLVAASIVGLSCRVLPRYWAHRLTILAVFISFIASCLCYFLVAEGITINQNLYTWTALAEMHLSVGFMIDSLTVTMMLIVTFVSLMVHIYTIGYMAEDAGYSRFFSYICLFTFAMLMLVMSNNFLQLFFGWEAVGLVSYLLIGFWFNKPTAIFANMKAFLVNRVGDLGFLMGIGLIYAYTASLDYQEVFMRLPQLNEATLNPWGTTTWSLITVICLALFVGAMGKSAQVPLHVWLPDSMEGPTPISALIHAATMVTAGVFMVSRMSPMFEMSDVALGVIIIIGSINALFMGILGVFQNDIKRIIAYSTLSQLGYMVVALGLSAYSVAVFHLATHAFFKALLFLAAGSVIIGMHHQQDIRHMGGLYKKMPITWITFLLASLSLSGVPLFSGFYSKDAIIEIAKHSNQLFAGFGYVALVSGVFITALYTFRTLFLVFHGKENHHHDDASAHSTSGHHAVESNHQPHESPLSITIPLVLLVIPSVLLGYFLIEPIMAGNWFNGVIHIDPRHSAFNEFAQSFHGPIAMAIHGLFSLPFALVLTAFLLCYYTYQHSDVLAKKIKNILMPIMHLFENNYYFDKFNQWFFCRLSLVFGNQLFKYGDEKVINQGVVHGFVRLFHSASMSLARWQSGEIYRYALTMIIGMICLLAAWFFYVEYIEYYGMS